MLDAAAAVDGSAAVVLSDSHHHHYHTYNQQQQLQQQNCYGGGYSQQQLTRLQDEILQCLETLEREMLVIDEDGDEFVSEAATTLGATDRALSTGNKNQTKLRRQLMKSFLCPLFHQLLKFCRFVCPPLPPPPTSVNTTSTNGSVTPVDHFHHHNKVCVSVLFNI